MFEQMSKFQLPSLSSFRNLPPNARREMRYGMMFIAPWIIGFIFFTLLPTLATFYFSFVNIKITDQLLSPHPFVGLDNYIRLFKDPQIWTLPFGGGSPEFGAGNAFNSGKAAMGLTQTWYTCCLADFKKAGLEFQLGIQPMGSDGKVHGRLDADTFRVWKGTKNPAETFTVLSYLITKGADTLLPVYGAMPAVPSKTQAFFDAKSKDYPFVTKASWDVFVQGLAYPDGPSAEQYLPNSIKANKRFSTFLDLMNNTTPDKFNFDTEYQKMVDDLNTIYNEAK